MRFLLHLGEMLLAMFAGMLLLDPVWKAVHSAVSERTDVGTLAMALNMTIGMTVWMSYRGHGKAAIAEMAAAMFLPFVVVLIPFWAGVMPGEMVSDLGHALMMAAMLAVMFKRRKEYSAPHHGHAARPRTGIVAALKRRWSK